MAKEKSCPCACPMKKPKRRQRKARAVPRRFPPPGILLPAQMVTQVPPVVLQQPVRRTVQMATRETQTDAPRRVEMGLQTDVRRATQEMPTQTEAEPGKELITYQRAARRSMEDRMRQDAASEVSDDKATGRQTDIRRFLK